MYICIYINTNYIKKKPPTPNFFLAHRYNFLAICGGWKLFVGNGTSHTAFSPRSEQET